MAFAGVSGTCSVLVLLACLIFLFVYSLAVLDVKSCSVSVVLVALQWLDCDLVLFFAMFDLCVCFSPSVYVPMVVVVGRALASLSPPPGLLLLLLPLAGLLLLLLPLALVAALVFHNCLAYIWPGLSGVQPPLSLSLSSLSGYFSSSTILSDSEGLCAGVVLS